MPMPLRQFATIASPKQAFCVSLFLPGKQFLLLYAHLELNMHMLLLHLPFLFWFLKFACEKNLFDAIFCH